MNVAVGVTVGITTGLEPGRNAAKAILHPKMTITIRTAIQIQAVRVDMIFLNKKGGISTADYLCKRSVTYGA